jgi:hypothetical protein
LSCRARLIIEHAAINLRNTITPERCFENAEIRLLFEKC